MQPRRDDDDFLARALRLVLIDGERGRGQRFLNRRVDGDVLTVEALGFGRRWSLLPRASPSRWRWGRAARCRAAGALAVVCAAGCGRAWCSGPVAVRSTATDTTARVVAAITAARVDVVAAIRCIVEELAVTRDASPQVA